jgi:hypothetical protein
MPLGPGSIAFTGFNADDPDSVAFVALEDIPAGTVIVFTDNNWNGTAFATNEGSVTLTLTSAISAGTVVRLEALQTTTPTTSSGSISRSGSFNLAGSTEVVYAYTGSATSPTFLTALANEGFTAANGLANTGLTAGTNAIDLGSVDAGADIAAYTGARTGRASFAEYRTLLNDPSNWVTQDATGSQASDGINPDIPFSSTGFTTSGAETQTVVFNPVTVTQAEGNSGSTLYTFTVTRTGGTTGVLDFAGTIAAGTSDGADFVGGVQPTSFSGSIAAGATSATVTVSIAGDTVIEADEAFQLTLTSVSNQSGISASIGSNATATGTITNDDTPILSINDVSLSEGNGGTTTYTFTVSLDRPAPDGGVTFDIGTANGTATTADGDYVERTLTSQTIPAGSTSYTFEVTVNGDAAPEPAETFFVNVTNVVNATVADGQGQGTIVNDDSVNLTINNPVVTEGNSGTTVLTYTVSLSGPAPAGGVTFDIATADGSATAGSDYVARALTGQTIPEGAPPTRST